MQFALPMTVSFWLCMNFAYDCYRYELAVLRTLPIFSAMIVMIASLVHIVLCCIVLVSSC